MDRKIESEWEGLMAAMVLARSDEKAKRFVHYGESIVDLVEQGDYKQAINVGGEFASEYIELSQEEMTPLLRKYFGQTDRLLSLLS